ncbi:MAG TPA: alpha/beta hydrolase [Candidatus Limnocylindrales bacterium]
MVTSRPEPVAPSAPAGPDIPSAAASWQPHPEQSRARQPDETGAIERNGVRIAWERYGNGEPTILLLPTWTIIHSRFWKAQIPFLARHFRVVTFDGRGNGRSGRPTDPAAYAAVEFVADALAVLDATGTERAIVAGLSMGGAYALMLAGDHPDRVMGALFFGAALPLASRDPKRDEVPFHEDTGRDDGWARYNAFSWRRDWAGFVEFFFSEVFSESHSTKHVEDAIDWGLATDAETMVTAEDAPYVTTEADGAPLTGRAACLALASRVRCPALVVHGTDDHIIPFDVGRRLAEAIGCPLVTMEGSGHDVLGREPVKVNLLIRAFMAELGGDR